jgi:hypothetical protein
VRPGFPLSRTAVRNRSGQCARSFWCNRKTGSRREVIRTAVGGSRCNAVRRKPYVCCLPAGAARVSVRLCDCPPARMSAVALDEPRPRLLLILFQHVLRARDVRPASPSSSLGCEPAIKTGAPGDIGRCSSNGVLGRRQPQAGGWTPRIRLCRSIGARFISSGESGMPWLIGVDVSKAKFDVALLLPNEKFRSKFFSNDPSGFAALLQWIGSQVPSGEVPHLCMEATGSYHEALGVLRPRHMGARFRSSTRFWSSDLPNSSACAARPTVRMPSALPCTVVTKALRHGRRHRTVCERCRPWWPAWTRCRRCTRPKPIAWTCPRVGDLIDPAGTDRP